MEGDSASSTELYALLRRSRGPPSKQRFAVTGSVNQRGQVQAIGGVNEKIEGYFAVCRHSASQGDEGVLIPKANVRNLMLSERVRDAIAKGRFHIFPVSTIDEGISLLTGLPRGCSGGSTAVYPKGSINRMVVDRLSVLTEKAREAAQGRTKMAVPPPKKPRPGLLAREALPGRRARHVGQGAAPPDGGAAPCVLLL